MIFLTVGNWRKGYERLVKAVDVLIENGSITDEVIAQIGPTKYKPKCFLKILDYCSSENFSYYIKTAEIIISHAGIGTIVSALKLKKPVIVVPRKATLREHFDNHQIATAQALESEGKVLVAYETDEIIKKIQQAKSFIPADTEQNHNIIKAVEDFIQQFLENATE